MSEFTRNIMRPGSGPSLIRRLKQLILPVRGISAAERPTVNGTVEGSIPSPGAISRRSFFSFMAVGGTMLARPDLFLGQGVRSTEILLAPAIAQWSEIGRVVRTWTMGMVQYAEVALKGAPMFSATATGLVEPTMTMGVRERGVEVGSKIYVGPGGQFTFNPPDEKIWAASQRMRGLEPGEVIKL